MSVRRIAHLGIRTIGLIMVLIFAVSGPSGAEKMVVKPLNVIGSAIVHERNLADGKQNAVNDALAAAVGQVAMEMLTDETVVNRFQLINEKILNERDNYILNYRVLTQSIIGNTVRTLVQVDIGADRLSRDLSALGLSASDETDPSAMRTIVEVVVEGTSGQIASFVRLRSAISSLSGVNDLKMKEMSTDQAVMEVNYQGTTRSLADALLLRTFDGFGIEIVEVTAESILIRLIEQ